MGLAWTFHWYYGVLFFIGALIGWWLEKRHPGISEEFTFPVRALHAEGVERTRRRQMHAVDRRHLAGQWQLCWGLRSLAICWARVIHDTLDHGCSPLTALGSPLARMSSGCREPRGRGMLFVATRRSNNAAP